MEVGKIYYSIAKEKYWIFYQPNLIGVCTCKERSKIPVIKSYLIYNFNDKIKSFFTILLNFI